MRVDVRVRARVRVGVRGKVAGEGEDACDLAKTRMPLVE